MSFNRFNKSATQSCNDQCGTRKAEKKALKNTESVDNESRSYKRFMGILPAFRHTSSGETHLSCEKDGTLAPIHQVDFLPSKWLNCNIDNSDCKLKTSIEKGYVVMGHFFNQEDASHLLPH